MPANIAYYVHHHGSGHVMRAIAICGALQNCQITFLGSNLHYYQNLIPAHINCIHLPMDTADNTDEHHVPVNPVAGLHYAPLNIKGLRDRNRLLTEFFSNVYPLLLIVDVSVEVALLARLCGVPTVVVRQHGIRTDQPHISAYQSANALLAPYPSWMQRSEEQWLTDKTLFTGGFSRYQSIIADSSKECSCSVAILTGKGGTSINVEFIEYVASQCQSWTFDIIGIDVPELDSVRANVIFHGPIPDPYELLSKAEIVIGNTGHNTVMEMASLNKRFIAIPEDRPFEEQLDKAGLLEKAGLATVINPRHLFSTNWQALLASLRKTEPSWKDTINQNAINRAANGILTVYENIYGQQSLTA